ncbi:uncharacterized protein LOC116805432 [Drosophila grimshawi]|uniref:uncharacterized protein LOC116805432 n=1 Tax=Drosophila grimshawi TaxID=7222 RepID=UPI000C86F868|nr:uncharacterized protein LOC116805432 [Drosophila grimshawi]
MYMDRCHKFIFLWFVIGVCAMQYVKARQDNNCAANGQYCQTHWECCSRKCMTYMYICAPKASQYHHNSENPTRSNYIDQYWNWIGAKPIEDDPIIVTLKYDKPTTTAKLNENIIQSTEKVDNVYDMITDRAKPDPTTRRTCKLVGHECSDSSECCTKRCAFYLHKCVT